MIGIAEINLEGELPAESTSLVEQLKEQSGKFISQEGATWDFKREWPFSYSDSYFGGIDLNSANKKIGERKFH
jgi:hypothetical protein